MNNSRIILLSYTALLFLTIGSTLSTKAQTQTYYWIGGNAEWNDPNAWSTTSGGVSAGKIPNQDIAVVFDQPAEDGYHVSINEPAFCNDLKVEVESLIFNITERLHVDGDFVLDEQVFFDGEGKVVFELEEGNLWDSSNSIFSGPVEFQGAGCTIASHLFTQNKTITIDTDWFNTEGKVLTCASFLMPAATEINVSGSSIYVNEEINVSAEVRVTQVRESILLSNSITEEHIHPGEFEIAYSANRTASCGEGDGQIPFTIEAIINSDYNGEDVSCNGAADGEAFVTVTGGVGPFSFQWVGGDFPGFTQSYSNLGAGTYVVVVTDLGQGIPCADNVQISEPIPITLFEFVSTPPSCDGLCDGSGTPFIVGGTNPFIYTWSTGEDEQTSSMLCEGLNTLTVTDINECNYDTTFVIELAPIFANIIVTDILCANVGGGSAASSPFGGDGGPYSWNWSTGSTEDEITELPEGEYSLTVSDAGGCSVDTTITILEFPPIVITLDDIQDVSCSGLSDGSISVTVEGGTPGYDYFWTGPNGTTFSDDDLINLEEGEYNLMVTDIYGCIQLASYSIVAPPAIDLVFNGSNILCSGEAAGEIDLTIAGGSPLYVVEWTGPNGFISEEEDLSNLEAGSYEVTVTDANLCVVSGSEEILEPEPLDVSIVAAPITCNGASDGSIDLTISGGQPPYSTDWSSTNGFVSEDEDLSGLESGVYDLILSDLNGCLYLASVDIVEPEAIDVVFDITPINCANSSFGAIDVTITGGALPYETNWTSLLGFSSSEENISGLIADQYELTITDFTGCQVLHEVFLDEPIEITVIEVITDVSCGGFADGEIEVSILGGAPEYILNWTGPNGFNSEEEDLSNLEAGDYDLTITDSEGCQFFSSFNVSETLLLEAFFDVAEVTCNGASDGSIDLTISGGQPPYSTDWSSTNGFVSEDEDLSGLESGVYDLILSDLNGCLYLASVDIVEPEAIDVTADITEPTCFGFSDGSIELSISGGVAPYSVIWNAVDTGSSLTDIGSGDYIPAITDDSGCEATVDPITLSDPEELSLSIVGIDILCSGEAAGEIDLTIAGGSPLYVVEWTGPNGFISEEEDLSSLEAGLYDVMVADGNDCAVTGSVEIDEPQPLEADAAITEIVCDGDFGAIDLTITGGLAPYTTTWTGIEGFSSADEDIFDLTADTYQLEVFDNNGCSVSASYELVEANPFTLETSIADLDCPDTVNGSVEIIIIGLTSPYSTTWTGSGSFNQIGTDIFDAEEGDYTITVTDDLGCVYSEEFQFIQPDSLVVSFVSGGLTCPGDANGQILTSISGGTPDYDVSWIGPNGFSSENENISNLEGGCYDITITDSNLCSTSDQYCINEPADLSFTAQITGVECFGEETGAIDVSVSGGSPLYTFTWFGPDFVGDTEDIVNLSEGQYDLQVIDQAGCSVDTMLVVEQSNEIVITPTITTPLCFSDNSGMISLDVEGGAPDYSFEWTDGISVVGTESGLNDLPAGTYTVAVTDLLGCHVSQEIVLTNPDSLEIDFQATNISCFGGVGGSIEIDIIEGTEPFQTDWVGPNAFTSSDQNIYELEAGSYELTLTDFNLCESVFQIQIDEPSAIELILDELVNTSCPDSQDGSINISVIGGEPDFNFTWTSNNGYSSIEEDISELNPGVYDLLVQDANGCLVELNSISLIFMGDVDAFVPDEIYDCAESAPLYLAGENQGGLSEQWLDIEGNTLSSDSVLSLNLDPGEYQFVYQAIDGPCIDQDTIDVIIWASPEVDAGEDLFVFLTQPAELGGNPTADFDFTLNWSLGELLDDSTAFNPVTIGLYATTEFLVTVTDLNGCVNSDSVVVNIIPEIDVPTGFTPNNDGQNDLWEISNVGFYQNISVEIYSRWGDLMYRSEGMFQAWDGTYGGNALPIGTYYYVININEPEFPNPFTGPVTIIR